MDAKTMSPDQTAPKGTVWSGSILFAMYVTKVRKLMTEQRTIVMDGKKRVTILKLLCKLRSFQ